MNKKILVITPTYLPILGGAEIGIYEIYRRLQKKFKVRILTPHQSKEVISRQGVFDEGLDEKELEVVRFNDWLNLTKLPAQRFLGKFIPPLSLSYLGAIRKQIGDFEPDLINMHYVVPGGTSIWLLKKYTRVPVVLSLISRIDVLGQGNVYFRKHSSYFYKALDSASYILPLSRYILGTYRGKTPVEIIPYGVDTKRFSQNKENDNILARLGIDKNRKILFTLQRLVRVKRIDLLIRSMEYILEKDSKATLIIGGIGPERISLENLVKKLSLEKNVFFTGFISEKNVPEYFAAADLFVFASSDETFGVVLAQAMAAGLPTVAIRSTAIPEVVVDRRTGILLDSVDPKSFGRAVTSLLNNKTDRDNFSKMSRKTAIQKYDWDIIARRYEDIFGKVLRRRYK